MRTRALWMAIGLTLAGGAFAFAGADTKGPDISELAKQDPHAVSDLASSSGEETSETTKGRARKLGDGERKKNHGFYVSAAAHCEDVDDTENDISFDAPSDCDSNGKAHGEYVSDVATSNAGKKP